ncbi:hypothetical protein [Streptomyces turgidiscabies]|uniref:hypothetical protein n=1 Tax=Streptomyces turgidiscabies TaxID=85558 RepID=UPI0038F819EB
MNQLAYPRTAAAIAARARMTLAAYRAVPGRDATHHLAASLHDMWNYGYFALHNDDTSTSPWTQTSQQLFDALQLLKPAVDQPTHAARAATDAIHRFEQVTGIAPGTAPESLYTRTEAERAVRAAFARLRLSIRLDHDNDRRFVTEAFLAFLDNPDSPYPCKSHDPVDEEDDRAEQPEPELSPGETAALVVTIRRLQQQCRFLLGQIAKKDAVMSGGGDRALAEFLGGEPAVGPGIAAADNPTPLRWDLNDVLEEGADPGTILHTVLDRLGIALPGTDAKPAIVEQDTLPAWLYQRFAVIHGCAPWDQIDDGQRAYWEHQARAVRRAVERNGFNPAAEPVSG